MIVLLSDISHFVEDVTEDLEHFKEKAEDAWHEMVQASRSHYPPTFDGFLRKGKRQVDSSDEQCLECGPPPPYCERGPPGTPGKPGEPGRW
nr:Nematode cuticle collagen domain containing protein [Haemonchus contortus]